MIIDKAKNYKTYLGMNENLDKALALMADFDPETPCGTYDVAGEDLFYIVTEPAMGELAKGRFEAHFKYIDLQYILRGGEWIKHANIADVAPAELVGDDCRLYDGEGSTVKINPGDFWVAFPEDAHMPGCYVGEPTGLKKVIFKVKMW